MDQDSFELQYGGRNVEMETKNGKNYKGNIETILEADETDYEKPVAIVTILGTKGKQVELIPIADVKAIKIIDDK